ncbi:hypothetical protein FRC05_003582 [Tulasnella sp. 425]|nr:hypothetical protein FRC05_003582 [Tulasnella sp. 425]
MSDTLDTKLSDHSTLEMDTDDHVPATEGGGHTGMPATPVPGTPHHLPTLPEGTAPTPDWGKTPTQGDPGTQRPVTQPRPASRAQSEAPASPTPQRGVARVLYPDAPPHPPTSDEVDETDAARIKRLADAFRKAKLVPDQVESKGVVQFPNYSHPRCLGTRSLWPPYAADDELCAALTTLQAQDHHLVWATAYKTMEITETELDLLKLAFGIIEEEELIAEFKISDYSSNLAAKGGKGLLIVAHSLDAYRRLMSKKIITIRSKTKSATFFLQHDDSWGTHVIYDIHNAGSDFERDVLPRFWKFSGDAVATHESKKEGIILPKDLAYYQVPWNPKTHKGAKGIVWRVRFVGTKKTNEGSWAYPRHLGHSNKGVIEVRRPPLCSHCISHSHAQGLCQWWKDGAVTGSKTKPDQFQETEYKTIKSIKASKLA